MSERPFVFTEVESYPLTLADRWRAWRFMERVMTASEQNLTATQKWKLRKVTLKWLLRPGARGAVYVHSGTPR